MLIILITVVAFIVFVIAWKITAGSEYDDLPNPLVFVGTAISGIATFLCIVFLLGRFDVKKDILKHEELRKVYLSDELRGEHDRAGILVEVAKSNGKLAAAKYSAKNLWTNWYYPQEILDVKPIE